MTHSRVLSRRLSLRTTRGFLGVLGTVIVAAAVWLLGSEWEWWSSLVIASPGDVWSATVHATSTGDLMKNALATLETVALSLLGGIVLGSGAGVLFWAKPLSGKLLEPYLVSFYTVPMVVFYPVLLVIIGVNRWPIVIIATAMASIPLALNVWTGLSDVRPVLLKLGRALCLTRWQQLRLIAFPAAAHLIIAGITIATIYALTGVVAMEFLVAQEGLGHSIRYAYESFDTGAMYSAILVLALISAIVVGLLSLAPRLFGLRHGGAR